MKNIENTLLRPSADPAITIVEHERCNGTGEIETGECFVADCEKENQCCGCIESKKTCEDCNGTGKVEIWR